MSFEKHIREHTDEFKLKSVNPDLWDRLDADLEIVSKNPFVSKKMIVTLIGFAILTLLAYFLVENKTQNEVLEETKQELFALKSAMNKLLENESSIKRIKAVSLSYNMNITDPDIIQIMINTMLDDNDLNVKLAAVNALDEYAHIETVKSALIEALSNSNEAFFKIKIINILSEIKEARALPVLDQIIDNHTSQGYLKAEAISARKSIKSL